MKLNRQPELDRKVLLGQAAQAQQARNKEAQNYRFYRTAAVVYSTSMLVTGLRPPRARSRGIGLRHRELADNLEHRIAPFI